MNSFSAIQKACDYEIARQIEVYEMEEKFSKKQGYGTKLSN